MTLQTKHWHAAAALEQAAWLRWKQIAGIGEATLKGHQWVTDKLLVAEPRLPFAEINDTHILNVLAEAKPTVVARWAGSFRDWMRWGRKTRRIVVDPTDFLPDFKEPPAKLVPIFTVEEEAALRALPEPHGTLMAILFDTGLRKSEARNLTGKRVDFEREQLIVIDGAKGGKQRLIPIDQETTPFLLGRLDQLLTMQGIGPDDYLWPRKPGGGSRLKHNGPPLSAVSFHSWWGKCIELAGVTYLKPHTSRHTMARRWRKRGIHMEDLQFLLGHADPRVTQRYAQTDIDDVRERMAAARKASGV